MVCVCVNMHISCITSHKSVQHIDLHINAFVRCRKHRRYMYRDKPNADPMSPAFHFGKRIEKPGINLRFCSLIPVTEYIGHISRKTGETNNALLNTPPSTPSTTPEPIQTPTTTKQSTRGQTLRYKNKRSSEFTSAIVTHVTEE